MTKITAILFLCFCINITFAQKKVEWVELAGITYFKQMDELLGFKVDMPVFSDNVKALEGEEIQIKGYIIPVDGYKDQKEFIFSAYPYSQCFFCGNAGPETVMEVFSNAGVEFTNEQITIKGILHLNDSDVNSLMFRLTDAKLVK